MIGIRGVFDRTGETVLSQVRSVILLGGAIRRNEFLTATRRSLLDLPVKQGQTLFDEWQESCARLAERIGKSRLPLRLLLDESSPQPELPAADARVDVRIERDPRPLRGTGGLLRDLSEQYGPDDFLLVANAGQVLFDPLESLVASMAATGGEICVVSHLDGTPSGFMLVRCECLKQIPAVGYVDMKEQGLPRISKKHLASVVFRDVPTGFPVRTFRDYIHALRRYHRALDEASAPFDPFAEDWRSSFHIVEEGADVDPDARLHDSVVLRGGRVQKDAFVARSIVCPSGVVPDSQLVVDELIAV